MTTQQKKRLTTSQRVVVEIWRRITAQIAESGATWTELPATNRRSIEIATRYGGLTITIDDKFSSVMNIYGRFADIKIRDLIHRDRFFGDRLNHASLKWNWRYWSPRAADMLADTSVTDFTTELAWILSR